MKKYFIIITTLFISSCATSYKYTSMFDTKILYRSGEKILDYTELNVFPPSSFMAAEYFSSEDKVLTNYYIALYIASKSKLNINSSSSKLYIKTDVDKITELKSKTSTSYFESGNFKNYNVRGYYFQIDKQIIENIFISDNIFLKLEENDYTAETKFSSGDYVFFTDFFDDNINKKYKYNKNSITPNLK